MRNKSATGLFWELYINRLTELEVEELQKLYDDVEAIKKYLKIKVVTKTVVEERLDE